MRVNIQNINEVYMIVYDASNNVIINTVITFHLNNNFFSSFYFWQGFFKMFLLICDFLSSQRSNEILWMK